MERAGSRCRIIIDGEELPYAAEPSVDVTVDTEAVPSVTLRLFADRVEVVDQATAAGPTSSGILPDSMRRSTP